MRQLFNWRFVAACAALVALALLGREILLGDDAIEAVIDAEPPSRSIDVIESISAIDRSPDFTVGRDGVTTGFLDATIRDQRVVRIAPGTVGEVECAGLDQPDACVLFAEVLGEAVIWFSIQPRAPRATVELPPIVDLEDGEAVFENGWRITYPPVIERDCPGEDIPTFTDFLRRFGPDSTSIVDLETRQVTTVRCGDPVDDA